MKPKILVTDGLAAEGKDIFEKNSHLLDVEICQGLKPAELLDKVKDVDGLVVRSATKVTKAVIEAANRLQIIGRAGIGVDNVDVDAATLAKIWVMNTPDENATTTAEHAIALLLAAARRIPVANRSLWEGQWDRKSFVGIELMGKTLGILGCGRIGKLVADRMKAFRMNVVGFDPYLQKKMDHTGDLELLNWDDFLSRLDVMMIHCPLTPETKYLVNAKAISKMKKGALLVNAARGGIVEEAAVLKALDSEHLTGYATDVFEVEPPAAQSALLLHPRVVATPHTGAQTFDAQKKVSRAIAEQILAYFEKGQVKNAVNLIER